MLHKIPVKKIKVPKKADRVLRFLKYVVLLVFVILLPLLMTRPISGGASTAVLSDILTEYGPDAPIGMAASVLCGASETVLYVLSVYTGDMPLSSTRHLLPAAILTCVFVTVLSLTLSRFLFGI